MNILRQAGPYLGAIAMATSSGCFKPENNPPVDQTRVAAHLFIAETLRPSPCKDFLDRVSKGLEHFGFKAKAEEEKIPNRIVLDDGTSEVVIIVLDTMAAPEIRRVLANIAGFGLRTRPAGSFAGTIETDCDDFPSAEPTDTSQDDFSRNVADAAIEIIARNLGCIATAIDAKDHVEEHYEEKGATYTMSRNTDGFNLIIRIEFPNGTVATIKASLLNPDKTRNVWVNIGGKPGQLNTALWGGDIASTCTQEEL